jgi:hypothetical protein
LGAPKFLFHLIALIKLLLRPRSQVRIGVRAAGKTKANEKNGRGSVPKLKFNPRPTKPYDLTNHLHTLTRHI